MKRLLANLLFLLLIVCCPLSSLAAEVVFYDTDNAGTPVAMWDKDGKKVWEGEYYPFGEEFRITESPADNKKHFVGKEKDEETGLTYFGARYMDETTGRFIAPDPVRAVDPSTSKTNSEILTNPQRLNRYVYGLNNPYRYVDPDGEFAIVAAAIIGAGVAYISSPDVANAPENSSSPTFESHGERSIAVGAIGGAGGVAAKTVGTGLATNSLQDSARVRHHTSVEAAKRIKESGLINPSRGGGVHVETMPFGSTKSASAETGAFGKGAYVEFDTPTIIKPTNVGPRNTGVIPTNKPLSIIKANPKYKKQ